jgi:hypothetical protein
MRISRRRRALPKALVYPRSVSLPAFRRRSSKQGYFHRILWILGAGTLLFGALLLWLDEHLFFSFDPTSLWSDFSSKVVVELQLRPNFTSLLFESGSDKYPRHHYERYYERWLSPMRDQQDLKLLEIGANQGHSLRLWSDFFAHPSVILGLAYGTFADGVEENVEDLPNVTIYRGDQSHKETMDYLNARGPWDIIIDDGSHVPQHMIFTLFHLWQSVTPGGLYIIEDLETNYWAEGNTIYGYNLPNTGIGADAHHSAVAKLMQLQHVLVRHQIGAPELSVMPGDDTICSMEWGMNLVLLRKCGLPADGPGPEYASPRMSNPREIAQWLQQARASNPE